MTWKTVTGTWDRTGNIIPEIHMMNIGEEEPMIIVIPKEEPLTEPVPVPVKEPVKEPEKVPAHTSQVQDWHMMRPDEDEKRFTIKPKEFPVEQPQPIKVPVKEPVKVPEKVPVKVGAYDDEEVATKPTQTVNGELIGYRHGLVAKRDGQWMLHSPIRPMPWERGVVTASCGNNQDHEAPSPGCRCGMYALWDEAGVTEEFGNHEWITQVKAWGRVIPGSKGFRTQHMQVTGIRPPKCEQCDKPASHMISANDNALSGRPTCEEHMPESIASGKIKIKATPIGDIAKELSNYYGGAQIKNQGEDWDNNDEMKEFEHDISGLSAYGTRWAKTSGHWARVGLIYPK